MYGTPAWGTSAAVSGGALAYTGLAIGWWIVAAATLMLAGAALLRLVPKCQK